MGPPGGPYPGATPRGPICPRCIRGSITGLGFVGAKNLVWSSLDGAGPSGKGGIYESSSTSSESDPELEELSESESEVPESSSDSSSESSAGG